MLEKESRRIYIKLPIVAFSNLENMDNFFLLNIRAKEKKKKDPWTHLAKIVWQVGSRDREYLSFIKNKKIKYIILFGGGRAPHQYTHGFVLICICPTPSEFPLYTKSHARLFLFLLL